MTDVERIFRALRSRWLFVRRAPLEDHGYWYATILVSTDATDDDALLDTLVHETLHALNPEKSENWVRRRTKRVMTSLTDRQRNRLTKFLTTVR